MEAKLLRNVGRWRRGPAVRAFAVFLGCVLFFAASGFVVRGPAEIVFQAAVSAEQQQAVALRGPSEAIVGQRVTFRLEGTPPLDASLPLGNQLAWTENIVIRVVGAAEVLPDTTLQLTIPLAVQVRIDCVFEKAGDYWLVVGWHNSPAQLLIHKITVVGGQPQPKPDPTPGPTPPGPKYVVIVEESSQRTLQAAAVIKDKNLREWAAKEGHVLRVVDKDGLVPSDLEPYVRLATEGGKKLPRLIVATPTGQILHNVELPPTVKEVQDYIK